MRSNLCTHILPISHTTDFRDVSCRRKIWPLPEPEPESYLGRPDCYQILNHRSVSWLIYLSTLQVFKEVMRYRSSSIKSGTGASCKQRHTLSPISIRAVPTTIALVQMTLHHQSDKFTDAKLPN